MNLKTIYVKRCLTILMILVITISALSMVSGVASAASGVTYYVAADGSGDGLSPENPMSLLQANSTIYNGGDKVLFRCGDIFYGFINPLIGNTTPNNRVEFGAYGEGALPIISRTKTISKAWTDAGVIEGKHFYKYDFSKDGDYEGIRDNVTNAGYMMDANGSVHGARRKTAAECVNEWDFFCDVTDLGSYVYVQSDTDPYASLGSLTFNVYGSAFLMPNNILVHDLHIKGSGYGFTRKSGGENSSQNISIYNCVIENIGGIYGYTGSGAAKTYSTKAGNGVEFFDTAKNCVVENNLFRNIYDVGFTMQGSNPAIWDNVNVNDNIFVHCTQAMEIWSTGTDAGDGVINYNFVDNLCIGGGEGWFIEARPDRINACDILTYSYESPLWKMNISNNAFYHAKSWSAVYSIADTSAVAFRSMSNKADNNSIYMAADNNSVYRSKISADNVTNLSLDDWRALSGMDQNSTLTVITDPSKYSAMENTALKSNSFNEIRQAALDAGIVVDIAKAEKTVVLPSSDTSSTEASSQETVTSSEETVTSSEEAVTSSQETVTSSEETVTSSQETVTSSEETVTSSQETVTSSQEVVTSTDTTVTSSQETVITPSVPESSAPAESDQTPSQEVSQTVVYNTSVIYKDDNSNVDSRMLLVAIVVGAGVLLLAAETVVIVLTVKKRKKAVVATEVTSEQAEEDIPSQD